MQHCATLEAVPTTTVALATSAAVDAGTVITIEYANYTALQLCRFSVRLSFVVHRSASLALPAVTTVWSLDMLLDSLQLSSQ
jgi:hypothetical protein